MTSLLPEVFAAHHARVATALALSAATDYFATYWLQSLTSPTGNDILQEVAVTATGRVNSATKHGADSTDGELEENRSAENMRHTSTMTLRGLCYDITVFRLSPFSRRRQMGDKSTGRC